MNRQKEILGAILKDEIEGNQGLADNPLLTSKLFSSGFERLTFDAIQELRENGASVDLEELARSEKLREIDGIFSMLSALLDGQHKLKKDVFDQKLTAMAKNQILLPLVNESKKAEHEILKRVDPSLDSFEKKLRKAVTELDKLGHKKEVHFESLDFFLSCDIPPRETLIDPILGRQEKTMIHAAPKFGKTALALQLACCGAEGRDWLGFKVKKKFTTLIIQDELSEILFKDRVEKVFDKCDAQDKIFIPKRKRKIFLETKAGRDYIAALVEEIKPDVIIIDPYIKFWEAEENAIKNTNLFFNFVDDLIREFGITLFLVHHDTKEQENREGGRKSMWNLDRHTDGNWNLSRIAGLPQEDYFKTVRLSFESRNWERMKPLDLRMHDDLQFRITEITKGKVNAWHIREAVEKAGGKIGLRDLRAQYKNIRAFYQAKDEAVEKELIIEETLEGHRGQPVVLSLVE